MTDTVGRVEEVRRQTLSNRLLHGAEILGNLRRRGLFCVSSWSWACPCDPESDFCRAKRKWLELYCELHGENARWILFSTSEFTVTEAMTVRQWHATRLTALVSVPYAKKPIRIGPHGTTWKTLVDLAALQDTADYASALQAVLKLQGAIR